MLSANAIQELGASKNYVNEQNVQALGFYLHIGFKVICRLANNWRRPLRKQGVDVQRVVNPLWCIWER